MLRIRSRAAALACAFHRDERGQVLIFFVVGIITVFLAVAAAGIDTGFWFGRRAHAQNAADLSARGGAIAFFGNGLSPCEEAAYTARQNGIEVSDPASCNDGPTSTNFGTTTVGGIEECLESVIDTDVPSMFTGIFGIDEVNIGAKSTACAGSAIDVMSRRVDTDQNRHGPEGIPVILADGGGDDCFNGNEIQPGVECVIWSALDDSQHNRLRWDNEVSCDGDVEGSTSEIVDGIEQWTCEFQDDVHADYVSEVSGGSFDQMDMRAAIQSRLGQSTTCSSLEGGAGPAASFRNAFERADGLEGVLAVPPLPFPGGANPPNAIYVQNDCFDNPRIVIVPITNRPTTTDENKDVDGFAVIYITGCYLSDAPMHTSPSAETETDTCQNWPAASASDEALNCTTGATAFCQYEVRGVPIRLFITDGAVGRLRSMTDDMYENDFPLTIQTVE